MKTLRTLIVLLAVGAVFLPSSVATAQQSGRWQVTLAPHFLPAAMSGDFTVKRTDVEVDAGLGDPISDPPFGFVLYFEARRGPWAIGIDTQFMNMDQDVVGAPRIGRVKQAATSASLYRRLATGFEGYIGLRINTVNARVQSVLGPEAFYVSRKQTWFDPYVGARITLADSSAFRLVISGDIGGFGVGSSVVWMVHPAASFGLGSNVRLGIGYRMLKMEYENEQGLDRLFYDMRTFGPEVGLAFTF